MYGTLLLGGSVAAARANDGGTARSFLTAADEAATRLGKDANHLWTAFGPTNVAIHRVATAGELGDFQVAIDLGPRVDTAALPMERRVRHALEVSRAYSSWNRRDDALTVLLDAERMAPEQVRHHFLGRQLVLTWIRQQRGKPSPTLSALRAASKCSTDLTDLPCSGVTTSETLPMATPRVAAGALIFDEQGRILLVKPGYKDGWEIPGGYVEPGESPRDACIREIQEELGLSIPIGGHLVVDWAPAENEGDKLAVRLRRRNPYRRRPDCDQVPRRRADRLALRRRRRHRHVHASTPRTPNPGSHHGTASGSTRVCGAWGEARPSVARPRCRTRTPCRLRDGSDRPFPVVDSPT